LTENDLTTRFTASQLAFTTARESFLVEELRNIDNYCSGTTYCCHL
jgi:hypothetical protein